MSQTQILLLVFCGICLLGSSMIVFPKVLWNNPFTLFRRDKDYVVQANRFLGKGYLLCFIVGVLVFVASFFLSFRISFMMVFIFYLVATLGGAVLFEVLWRMRGKR